LELELQFLKILDYVSVEPFVFAFQDKMVNQYTTTVFDPVLQNNENLRTTYENLKVPETFGEIKKVAEDVALKHGVKESFSKRFNKISLTLMIAIFAVLIVVTLIPAMADYSTYILFPALFVFCLLPQVLRSQMQKKWNAFVAESMPEFTEQAGSQIKVLQEFNQELIFDLRDNLLANHLPLQIIRFVLHSNEYQGLKLIEESPVQNQTQYLFEIAYPPGMEPIEAMPLPQTVEPESDDHDEFASFVIIEFEGESIKDYSFNYLPRDSYDAVNEMLNETTFADDKQARDFMADLNSLDLACRCGAPLVITDCKLCKWEKNIEFNFFFATSEKCNCGEITYVLCADPKDVPEQLRDFFI